MTVVASQPLIAPHGGSLQTAAVRPRRSTDGVTTLAIDAVARADFEMLAVGAYSPLRGYLDRHAQHTVASDMRLPNGMVWPIPITLPAPEALAHQLKAGDCVVLLDGQGTPLGEVSVEEVYQRDPVEEARLVFGTDDTRHPGVALLIERGPWCIAGPVHPYEAMASAQALGPCLTPTEVRLELSARQLRRVVGFQTRNPIHRAHEYILKCALEICDGLLLHPLVGVTKDDDIPAPIRVRCYEALLNSVLPRDRVLFSLLPAPMRYAGPREAILHALVRQNYGCSHFIVGRDHAGVGNYYGTYAAQQIFSHFRAGEIAIEPLMFEHSFFCRSCSQMASRKTCPHSDEQHVMLSGTKVREMLRRGERPPVEFSRPEVADVLIEWARDR